MKQEIPRTRSKPYKRRSLYSLVNESKKVLKTSSRKIKTLVPVVSMESQICKQKQQSKQTQLPRKSFQPVKFRVQIKVSTRPFQYPSKFMTDYTHINFPLDETQPDLFDSLLDPAYQSTTETLLM